MVDRAGSNFDQPRGRADVRSPWLDNLPEPIRKACSVAFQMRHYRPGEALYAQGETPPGLFGITSGTVQTVGLSSNGHPTLLSISRPGDWTGFLGVLDGKPAPFSVVATSPVQALLLPNATANEIFGESPETLGLLIRPLVQILRVAFDYLIETNNREPIRVVARRLLDLSRCVYLEGSTPGSTVESVNQASVAAASYLTRQTVNRTLHILARRGLIEIGYGRINILDAAQLEEVAGGMGSPRQTAGQDEKARTPFVGDISLTELARSRLSQEGWLPTLPQSLRERVMDALVARRCVKGDVINRRGDPPAGLYSMASGQCRTSAIASDDREYLFSLLHSGSWTGFASIFDQGPQPFSVVVTVPGVAVLLPADAMREIFFRDVSSYRHLMSPVLGMLRAIYDHLTEGNYGSPDRVVARRLYDLARLPYVEGDEPRNFVDSLTQDDLAAATGLSRPTINRVVKQLEKDGIIERGYGRVVIRNPDGLKWISRPVAGQS